MAQIGRKAALRTLYRLSDGNDYLWDFFRELSHKKMRYLNGEEETKYKELVSIKMNETIGEQPPPPDVSGEDLAREDMDEDERNAEEWRDAYPDDDANDDRLPSERFYNPKGGRR